MLTIDQRRAQFALKMVEGMVGKEEEKAYRSYVRKFPFTVRKNGLAQALALELAQTQRSGGDALAHQSVLSHVSAWLVDPSGWGERSPYQSKDQRDHCNTTLVSKIIGQTENDMIATQYEAMAYLRWLKTFAEALISAPDGGPAPHGAS